MRPEKQSATSATASMGRPSESLISSGSGASVARHCSRWGLASGGFLPGPSLLSIEAGLKVLEGAGLDREQAAEMIRTLMSYAVGYAMLELSAPPPSGQTRLEQIVSLTRALPQDTPMHLVEVARLMCDCDMDYQFKLGLDLILTGLEARLP